MTDLDTNQNDCPFWGDHVEGRTNSGDSMSIIPLFCLLPGFRSAKSFVKAGLDLSF
jgi:hypothetical protein